MFEQELTDLQVKIEEALVVIRATTGSRVTRKGAYMNRRQAEEIMNRALNQVHDLLYHVGSVPDVLAPEPKPKAKVEPKPKAKVEPEKKTEKTEPKA